MIIKFGTLHTPRKPDGSFQDYRCDGCGAKTTVYLTITVSQYEFYDDIELDLCHSCLDKGIKMICDRTMEKILCSNKSNINSEL